MKARSSDPPKAPVRKAKKAPSGGDSRLQGVWGCESRPPGAFGIGGSGISSCSSVGADLGQPSSTKTIFLSREGRPRSPPTGGGPAQVSQSRGATEVVPYGCQPGDRPPPRSRRTGRWTRRSCRTPRAGRARSRARRPRPRRPTPSSRPWRARPARSPGRPPRPRWP